MVTGIEAAGLALAVLPLLVNQVDSYALGIERIKILRRYRREFKGYSIGLETQHKILLNTLEQALEGVVDDDDEISKLISDPQGEAWADAALQDRLRRKLNRNYDIFVKNMTALADMLDHLSRKLRIGSNHASPASETWDLWKFRKILSKTVYDDLLAKIDAANTILKLLIDQSDKREATRKRRQPWSPLLKRYKKVRKHAEGLFQTITEGNYWRCNCKEQHCVQLQLQINPLENVDDRFYTNSQSQFRVLFSNNPSATSSASTDCLWTWTEVVFRSSLVTEVEDFATLSLYDNSTTYQAQSKSKVHFSETTLTEEASEMTVESPCIPPIQDFCSSLNIAETHFGQQQTIGFVPSVADSSYRYIMEPVRSFPKGVLQKPLHEILSQVSRRDRLYIAAGLACGAIQFCGNWLKASWDSSDIHLAAAEDGYSVLMDNLYLSWPFLAPGTRREPCDSVRYPDVRDNLLLPLGLALVELSLGKNLSTFFAPEDEHQEQLVTKFRAASRLVKKVHLESGTHYADAVHTCLHWPGVSSMCHENKFEERVFDSIVSPLLKDLANFEGLT